MILERFKVPPQDQVLVSEAALRRTTTQIFEKLGVTPEDAADAADVLTMTDLRGVETHGVSNMLRVYVRDYRAGKLDPRPGWKMEREAPGTAVIDAEKRLGIIVGAEGDAAGHREGAQGRRRDRDRAQQRALRRDRPLRDAGRPGRHGGRLLHRRRAARGADLRREAAARHQPDRARRAGAPRGAAALRRGHLRHRGQQDPAGHAHRLAAARRAG